MTLWANELRSLFGPQVGAVGKYSQSYQDSLLDFIFENLSPPSDVKTCVEFGFNSESLTEGSGSNVAKLVLDHGYKSWLFDAEHENPSINLFRERLTPESITQVFDFYGIPRKLGYISIDVDSLDYWLFASLLKSHHPLVFSVEYNANFSFSDAVSLRGNAGAWDGTRKYGASLRALVELGSIYNYECVWVVPTLDVFFVDKSCSEVIPFNRRRIGLACSLSELESVCSIYCHKPVAVADLDSALEQLVRVTPLRLNDNGIDIQEEILTRADKEVIRALSATPPFGQRLNWKFRPGWLKRLYRKAIARFFS